MNQEVSPTTQWMIRFLVTTCVVTILVVIPALLSPFPTSSQQQTISIALAHAGSLRNGSPISFRGIRVGKITSVELSIASENNIARAQDSSDEAVVLATGTIQREVLALVTEDSTVTVQSSPHPGIDILPGTGNPLIAGTTLSCSASPFGDPQDEYIAAIRSLRIATDSIASLADLLGSEGGLKDTLRTMGDAGHSVRDTAEELRILVRDGRSPLLSSLQQAEEILYELRAHTQTIPEVSESIVRFGRKGESVLSGIDKIVHENRGSLRASLENFESTTEDLHGLAADLRRRPWRILKSPGDRESAFIALHESANRYAEGALEVRRATEQVRDLLERRGEDREVIQFLGTALQDLRDRLDQQQQLEEGLHQRTQDLAKPR